MKFKLVETIEKQYYEEIEERPITEGKYLITFMDGPTGNEEVIVNAENLDDATDMAYRMPQATSGKYANLIVGEYANGNKSFGCVLKTELIWDGRWDGRNKGEIILCVNASDKSAVVRWARRNIVGKYIHSYVFNHLKYREGKQCFFDEPIKKGQDWKVIGIDEVYYMGPEDPNYETVT